MRVLVASEHAGFRLRNLLVQHLVDHGHDAVPFGAESEEPTDYPPIIEQAADQILNRSYDLGIFICGTGIGVSLAASKVAGILPAICVNEYMARMARAHNNANVLCLGSRVVGESLAKSIVDAFLSGEFEAGRHARRIGQVLDIERRQIAGEDG